jgi:hypothetical protein
MIQTIEQIAAQLKRWAIAESEGHPLAPRWVDYYDRLYFQMTDEKEISMDEKTRRLVSDLFVAASCTLFTIEHRAGLAGKYNLITHDERRSLHAAVHAMGDHLETLREQKGD